MMLAIVETICGCGGKKVVAPESAGMTTGELEESEFFSSERSMPSMIVMNPLPCAVPEDMTSMIAMNPLSDAVPEDCLAPPDDGERFRSMALLLEARVQKYPKSGSRFLGFKGLQGRYVAIMPMVDTKGEDFTERQLWCRGKLAYWESNECFKLREAPKGEIDLLRIFKVTHNKHGHQGREVNVKHKGENKEPRELVLVFGNEMAAQEWAGGLWALLKELPVAHSALRGALRTW